jgi:hypothetical protein
MVCDFEGGFAGITYDIIEAELSITDGWIRSLSKCVTHLEEQSRCNQWIFFHILTASRVSGRIGRKRCVEGRGKREISSNASKPTDRESDGILAVSEERMTTIADVSLTVDRAPTIAEYGWLVYIVTSRKVSGPELISRTVVATDRHELQLK